MVACMDHRVTSRIPCRGAVFISRGSWFVVGRERTQMDAAPESKRRRARQGQHGLGQPFAACQSKAAQGPQPAA